MPLTDTAIRKSKAGITPKGEATTKSYKMGDSGGLYLEVSPAGGKLWRWKYRFAGKEKRLSLGIYPDVGLADVRGKRDAARRLLAAGIDPSEQRKAEKAAGEDRAANSFEVVAREWLAVKAHEWTQRQLEKEQARLANHAFPWIGGKPIGELGVRDIKPLIDRVRKAGHLEQAHRLRFQLSRVFQYAVATERAERDPAADLKAALPSRRNMLKQNYATITNPVRVGELLRAMDGFTGTFPVACALRLAPLWFCRPGEIRMAEWANFDLDSKVPAYVVPASIRKLRRAEKEDPNTPPHTIPLSEQAVVILRELHALTGRGKYLFPGARDPKRNMSDGAINAALARIGFKDEIVGHGFRHMASTLLREMGWSADAVERQLSHKEPGVAGVYNKAQHLPERRKMMQAWADYLDNLRASSNVVPIRQVAA